MAQSLLDEDWLRNDLEKTAVRFATVELAQQHVADVKARRLPEIDNVEQEVRVRLKKEINYWDARAFELKGEERAGKKTRLNWQNAQRRAGASMAGATRGLGMRATTCCPPPRGHRKAVKPVQRQA